MRRRDTRSHLVFSSPNRITDVVLLRTPLVRLRLQNGTRNPERGPEGDKCAISVAAKSSCICTL